MTTFGQILTTESASGVIVPMKFCLQTSKSLECLVAHQRGHMVAWGVFLFSLFFPSLSCYFPILEREGVGKRFFSSNTFLKQEVNMVPE